MLSSKDGDGTDGYGIWKHDANQQRNSFYGSTKPSSLVVVSNEDPSAIKTFRSISLESNQKDWSVSFRTNEEYEDYNSQQTKEIKNRFIDKEGFKYMEIPRSFINSTDNIIPCGILPIGIEEEAEPSPLEEFDYYNYPVAFDSTSGASTPSGILLAVVDGNLLSFLQFTGGQFNDIKLTSVYPDANTVYLDLSLNIGVINNSSNPQSLLSELEEKVGAFIKKQNFVKTPAEINGDQMRGPYIKAELNIITSDPLELHAVNVDYEFSKLDKRLTQNS